MAELDLSVYKTLGNLVTDGMKAYQQGFSNVEQSTKGQRDIMNFVQEYGQAQIQNDLKNIASQLENAKSQAEYDRIKRYQDYRLWDAQRPTDLKADGSYDFQTYLKAATEAGYGDYAKDSLKTLAENLGAPLKQQQTNVGLIRDRAIEFAKGLQGQDDVQKAEAANQFANDTLESTGIDIRREFGQNWFNNLVTAQRTPEQLRTDRQVYDTLEGRKPNSTVSVNLRNTLNANGANIPENVSAFEIMSNETYRTMFDKLPMEMRTAAIQGIGESNVQIEKVQELSNRIDRVSKEVNVKPIEKIAVLINKLGNTPYLAEMEQIVAELKAIGIEINESTDLAGVKSALNAKLGELGVKQGGQQAILQNKTIPTVATTPPIAAKTYSIEINGQQFDGITEKQLKLIKAHKNAGAVKILN